MIYNLFYLCLPTKKKTYQIFVLQARKDMIKKLLTSENNILSDDDLEKIASLSNGYSGADMKSLCQEAAIGPIRSMSFEMINKIQADQVNCLM